MYIGDIMNELIEKYANQVFSVYLCGNDYNAIFRAKNNILYFEVKIDKETEIIKIWNKKVIKLIDGIYNDHKIVLIKSYANSICSNVIKFTIDILLDGFTIGKNVKNKKITKFLCSYSGINEFDLSNYYTHNISEDTVKALCMNDEYLIPSGNLIFHRTNRIKSGLYAVNIEKINEFEFVFNKRTDIYSAIKEIWHIRNLFCIFSKKNIVVDKISLYSNNDQSGTLFMNFVNNTIKRIRDPIIEHEEKRFIINYNNIKDSFGDILQKSKTCFENISPIISMYIDSKENKMPKLNKFLAFCQMIEGFSREYDDINSYQLMIKKEPKKAKNDTELKYRLNSLIKRVNYLFRYKTKKIADLSEKISKGRNYYIHHDKTKKFNELTNDELFNYGFFLEDILLANIYMEIGINKNVIKKSYFNKCFYYDKSRL